MGVFGPVTGCLLVQGGGLTHDLPSGIRTTEHPFATDPSGEHGEDRGG